MDTQPSTCRQRYTSESHGRPTPRPPPLPTCDHEVPERADRKAPHLGVVARQLQQQLEAVQVPVLDQLVLAGAAEATG